MEMFSFGQKNCKKGIFLLKFTNFPVTAEHKVRENTIANLRAFNAPWALTVYPLTAQGHGKIVSAYLIKNDRVPI